MQTELSTKDPLFFRLLVNKYFTGKADSLSKLLPANELEELKALTTPLKEPTLALFNASVWQNRCDPSWFVATLKKLDPQLQKIYLQILPDEIATCFCNTEQVEKPQVSSSPLAPPAKQFLIGFLHSLWQKDLQEKEPIAKELVQPKELGVLLEMNKGELLEIADLLSMHILVDEVRHVVDKRILQALSQLLSQHQQQYLRMCLRQKTKHHAPTFSLRERLAEPQKFLGFLHKTGLKRMATALSGEDPSFIWYILHTLDTGRAKFLQADIQQEPVAHATRLAQLEILQILQFLKTGEKS